MWECVEGYGIVSVWRGVPWGEPPAPRAFAWIGQCRLRRVGVAPRRVGWAQGGRRNALGAARPDERTGERAHVGGGHWGGGRSMLWGPRPLTKKEETRNWTNLSRRHVLGGPRYGGQMGHGYGWFLCGCLLHREREIVPAAAAASDRPPDGACRPLAVWDGEAGGRCGAARCGAVRRGAARRGGPPLVAPPAAFRWQPLARTGVTPLHDLPRGWGRGAREAPLCRSHSGRGRC